MLHNSHDPLVKIIALISEMTEGQSVILERENLTLGEYAAANSKIAVLNILQKGVLEIADAKEEDIDHESMSLPELAATLKYFKEKLDFLGAEKTLIQKKYDFLSIDVIPDRMDEEGVDSMKVAGVGRLQTSSDIRCNVLAANRIPLQLWLTEHGHGSMISETINASTLKAFIKEMMKEDKPYPNHLVKVEPFSRATVVKG